MEKLSGMGMQSGRSSVISIDSILTTAEKTAVVLYLYQFGSGYASRSVDNLVIFRLSYTLPVSFPDSGECPLGRQMLGSVLLQSVHDLPAEGRHLNSVCDF